jgi:hypothetical protein
MFPIDRTGKCTLVTPGVVEGRDIPLMEVVLGFVEVEVAVPA